MVVPPFLAEPKKLLRPRTRHGGVRKRARILAENCSMTSSYWNLALPCPLRRLFCYRAAGKLAIQPGDWVDVPFGQRQVRALVIQALETPPSGVDLRDIEGVAPEQQRLPESLMELIQWASRYYHAPPWEVVSSLLPGLLSRGGMPQPEPVWRPAQSSRSGVSSRAKRQVELLDYLDRIGPATRSQIRKAGFSAAIFRQLEQQDLLQASEPAISPLLVDRSRLHTPSPQQASAIEAVRKLPAQRFLLEGVTGSGKSLVYQHLVADALEQGGQVLVLVPEIGLVQPMVDHLAETGVEVSTYNSSMTDRERALVWAQAAAGQVRLVVGTRSAVALPMPNLQLMILDEEHDTSYKQQEGMRYQARDLAQLRSVRQGFGLLMGSATPSLEVLNQVDRGSVISLEMPNRVGGAALPTWQLTDAAHSAERPFSQEALQQMAGTLKRGEQVMVFLNRRGYSPLLQCLQCGWQARCPLCEVRLTWHRSRREMRCHQCDQRSAVPQACGHCHSSELLPIGLGTERLEEQMQQSFPGIPIIRIDRDSVRGREGFKRQVSQVGRQGAAILVGTQMLAKGHHFPNLSLAVVLDLDFALQSADFKAAEQAVQLVTQVAGRTGREKLAGQVLAQTALPAHPLFTFITANNYAGFARAELQRRQQLALPPVTHMALVRAECDLPQEAEKLLKPLQAGPGCTVLGPYPCLTERRQGRYRYQVQLVSENRSNLHKQLDVWVQLLEKNRNRKVRWHLDIDPASLDG